MVHQLTNKNDFSVTAAALKKFRPEVELRSLNALCQIWDGVVDKIVTRMLDLTGDELDLLHINIKPEMSFELSKLLLFLAEQVVEKRLGDRDPELIDLECEHVDCFGESGLKMIDETAKNLANGIWLKLYRERWKPKSLKALERDKNPPKTVLSVKPVGKNHYIAKFFLREYWSNERKVAKYAFDEAAFLRRSVISFGAWGYEPLLYSDHVEAWFSLIEGDARRPLDMMLKTVPLNDPQRLALLGFLVVQHMRTPPYRSRIISGTREIAVREVGVEKANEAEFQRQAFETIFQNNELYDRIARPLLWSQWHLVKSKKPVFVLPDCASFVGKINKSQVMFAPLTPYVCFVTNGIPEEVNEVIPRTINDQPIASRLANFVSVRPSRPYEAVFQGSRSSTRLIL